MPNNGTVAYVTTLPNCDFHMQLSDTKVPARYDFRTNQGPWANGCDEHYEQHRMHDELGLGKGQRLVTERERKEL